MTMPTKSKKPRAASQGYIYFAQASGNGPIKIGFSRHPKQRFAAIASGFFLEIDYLGHVPATSADEKATQNRFIDFVIRNEWFRPEHALTIFIYSTLRAGQLPADSHGHEFTPSLCRVLTERRARERRTVAA